MNPVLTTLLTAASAPGLHVAKISEVRSSARIDKTFSNHDYARY